MPRYSLSGFHLEGLERMPTGINRTWKRNKAFDADRVQGRVVAALDGIEALSSYSRHCDSCLDRRVTIKKAGVKVERVQYYHRAVGCQIIGGPVKTFLALEWLQPGEGEDTAALRLPRSLPDRYGSRFFDILLLDALYAQVPAFKLAAEMGWDLVVSLKGNLPGPHQSALRLFARRPADCQMTERCGGKHYQIQIWDTEGLPFSADYPAPVRVVRSEESLTRNHYRRDKPTPETTEHEWLWVTTLDAKAFPAPMVRRLGHDRWKQENNGWNDLTRNWAFKHGFPRACRHRPPASSQKNDDEPAPTPAIDTSPPAHPAASLVANCGLAAVSLIVLLAFTLSMAFTHCHSKLFRRYRMTTAAVACQLRQSVSKLPPKIRAPDSPAVRQAV